MRSYDDYQGITEMLLGSPVATPKPAPKWTLTPRGMLHYNGRGVADMRLKAGREQADFVLKALNDAEEKRQ